MEISKKAKFWFYQIPNGEDVLTMLGSNWIKEYGIDENGNPVITNHFHNLLEVAICRWGNGIVVFDNDEMNYEKGTVIVVPRNYPHNIKNMPKETSYWEYIYINPSHFLETQYGYGKRELEKAVSQIEQRPLIFQKEKMPMFIQELECIMNQMRTKGYGYRNCIKGLVYALLMEIIKINSTNTSTEKVKMHTLDIETNAKLKLAMEYINENYSKGIKMADISDAAYISESYLRKLFSEYYGMSPLQYLDQVRIHHACTILKSKDKNISEVAREVGFNNNSTFISNFKKFIGKPPKQWLKEVHAANKISMH